MHIDGNLSLQTLKRMPLYLCHLRVLSGGGKETVSARSIAEALSLTEIQVRKDLAAVSDGGRPRVGYRIGALISDIEACLGYDDVNDAALVGAGRLGRALMGYPGFRDYGLNILAAFDADPAAQGADASGKQVFPMEKLTDLCRRLNIRIGVITVPADSAQAVCDRLVEAGVTAVWNFAPVHLHAPEGVLIKNENMAASLAQLSRHLKKRME